MRVHTCMCAVRTCVEEVLMAAAQGPLAFENPGPEGGKVSGAPSHRDTADFTPPSLAF